MAGNDMKNFTLYPHLLGEGKTSVFDDPPTNRKEEAFVLGMSEMIFRLVDDKAVPDAAKGFAMHFSDQPFDGADAELTWMRSDDSQVVPGQDGSALQMSGNWYGGVVAGQQVQGGGLLLFRRTPTHVRDAGPLPPGVDPIWHVSVDDLIARKFLSAPGELQG